MTGQILLFVGAFLTTAWGVSHLFPTRNVVAGFGEISADNRHIITMEWIVEGVALIFVGVLVAVVTIVDRTSVAAGAAYTVAAAELVVLAVVSLFTGFKVDFLPFKLCPVIFTTSAILIIAGALL